MPAESLGNWPSHPRLFGIPTSNEPEWVLDGQGIFFPRLPNFFSLDPSLLDDLAASSLSAERTERYEGRFEAPTLRFLDTSFRNWNLVFITGLSACSEAWPMASPTRSQQQAAKKWAGQGGRETDRLLNVNERTDGRLSAATCKSIIA